MATAPTKRTLEMTQIIDVDGSSSPPPAKKFRVEMEGEEKERAKTNTTYNTNNRIVKNIYLSHGKALTTTFLEGKQTMIITHDSLDTRPIEINGEAMQAALESWPKISSSFRNRIPRKFNISDDSDIPVAVGAKDKTRPKLVMDLYHYQIPGADYGQAFRMKLTVPGCTPKCAMVGCMEYCAERSVVLIGEDMDKITRSRKFILEHAHFLNRHVECYNIMQDCIISYMKELAHGDPLIRYMKEEANEDQPPPLSSEDTPLLLNQITTRDLKKTIIEAFLEECDKRNVTTIINRYALYGFCMGQPQSLQSRWHKEEEVKMKKKEMTTTTTV
jgi:hypothetical protein